MSIKDQLKKEYDKTPIEDVESFAFGSMDTANRMRGNFIKTLYYLQFTSRFKESKGFKKATFAEYLQMKFGITEPNYNKERQVFLMYPKEAKEFGVGATSRLVRDCGPIKAPKAFDHVRKVKNKPLKQAVLEASNKFGKPKQKKNPAPSVKSLQAQLSEKDKIIQSQNLTIKEQVKQIAKLKAALKDYKQKYESANNVIIPIKKMVAGLEAVAN